LLAPTDYERLNKILEALEEAASSSATKRTPHFASQLSYIHRSHSNRSSLPYLCFYSKSQQQAHLQSEWREHRRKWEEEVMDWILAKLEHSKKVARPKRLVSHEKRAKKRFSQKAIGRSKRPRPVAQARRATWLVEMKF